MSELLNRMFGIGGSGLRLGDPGVTIDWTRPIPSWGWLLIALAAARLAWWSYRKLDAPRRWRGALVAVRMTLFMLLAVLIAGPRLAKQNQSVEKDWIVILADRSSSVTLRDVAAADGLITRDQQLARALEGADPAWAAAAKARRVLWLAFDGGVSQLASGAGPGEGTEAKARPELPPAKGVRTDLAAALTQVARLTAARPVAGVVLLSDGRTPTPPSDELLEQFQGRQIPVLVVPLGNPKGGADLAVAKVESPTAAFVGDPIPINVTLSKTEGATPQGLKIVLIDKATGATLDEAPVAWEKDESGETSETRTVVTFKPTQPGAVTWVVKLVSPTPDIVPVNDEAEVTIALTDRPIRVAYFDGYPRWEYRYLKNLLVREATVKSSISLLAAQRKFIQEGTDPLLSLPRTMEEWRPFDVVILGDLRPEMFSKEQLELLRNHVARNGAGLLMIGGQGPMPSAWRGSPVADLVPFTLAATESSGGGVAPFLEPVLMVAGPAADRLGLLRLGEEGQPAWPAVMTDPAAGWTALRLAQKIDADRVKPAAEVLATALPVSQARTGERSTEGASPLVVTMRYGAGRVVYVATDEIWRWRYARGETLPERFWLPMIRLLARQGLETSGQPATLSANPRHAQVDRPVQVSLQMLDQSLMDVRPPSVRVRVAAKAGAGADSANLTPPPPDAQIVLTPQREGDVDAASDAPNFFATSWIPSEPGVYVLSVDDPLLPSTVRPVEVTVAYPDDELRTPQPDHPLLASIASRTGGRVVDPAKLADAVAELPDRQIRLVGAPTVETLWDKPAVWVLLMVILGVEWIGRRLIRLP